MLEGPARVVQTIEVLGEPLLEFIPPGFTKEVVTLESKPMAITIRAN